MARKTRKRKKSHYANASAAGRETANNKPRGVACAEVDRGGLKLAELNRSEIVDNDAIHSDASSAKPLNVEPLNNVEPIDSDLAGQSASPSESSESSPIEAMWDSLDAIEREVADWETPEPQADDGPIPQAASEVPSDAVDELAGEVCELQSIDESPSIDESLCLDESSSQDESQWQSEWQPAELSEAESPEAELHAEEDWQVGGQSEGASPQVATSAQSQAILDAVDGNQSLLRQLISDFAELQSQVLAASDSSSRDTALRDNSERIERGDHETAITLLRDEIATLEDELCELKRQNSDLAAKVANANVKKSTSDTPSDFTEALSWEERKQLILRQMEEDCFDAETFLTQTVQSRLNDADEDDEREVDPVTFVEELTSEVTRLQQQNERLEKEISELNHLLENRPQSAGGMAIGAAAIAEMIDADELIQEERQRLQALQTQWEEKFRQAEIEASLERAKLSRERQEVATKIADLDEQLDRLRREAAQNQSGEGHSRKWLAKLGLAGDD
ncbi:hypothetical protein [Novipirellula caenicola]